MVDSLSLLLGGVTGQSRSNPLQLLDSNRMEAPQGFSDNWYKGQTLCSAEFCSTSHLVLKSN